MILFTKFGTWGSVIHIHSAMMDDIICLLFIDVAYSLTCNYYPCVHVQYPQALESWNDSAWSRLNAIPESTDKYKSTCNAVHQVQVCIIILLSMQIVFIAVMNVALALMNVVYHDNLLAG